MNGNKWTKRSLIVLLVLICFLLALTIFFHEVFIFVAIAPIFALLDHPWTPKSLYITFLAALMLVIAIVLVPKGGFVLHALFYIAVIVELLVLYLIGQYRTQGRLNKFSLIIVCIGVEYLFLKFFIFENFLADILQDKPSWTRWNIYTGYLGAGLWILLTNLLFYQAVFKKDKINVFLIALGIAAIGLPMLYSFYLTNNPVTKDQLIRLYSGDDTNLPTSYAVYGELISRTGAWVSILIIIFTLVRAKTKKVAR